MQHWVRDNSNRLIHRPLPNLNLNLEILKEMENTGNNNVEIGYTPLRDHFTPTTYAPTSCINMPEIGATHYEIQSSIIQMLPSFYGLSNEDPYKHLDEF